MFTRRQLIATSSLAAAVGAVDAASRAQVQAATYSLSPTTWPSTAPTSSTTTTTSTPVLPTPQAYGAKGDGVTDDSAAFSKALAANKVVYVPPLHYAIGAPIVLNAGNSLVGLGAKPYDSVGETQAPYMPQFRPKLSATAALTPGMFSCPAAYGVRIEGLALEGYNRTGSAVYGPGQSAGNSCVSILNCGISHFDWGIANAWMGLVEVVGCRIGNNNWGCGSISDFYFCNNDLASNIYDGLSLWSGAGAGTITGNRFEWNGRNGVSIAGFSVTIASNHFDANGACGVAMDGATGISIVGNHFRGNGRAATNGSFGDNHIYMNNSSRVTISGNTTSQNAPGVTNQPLNAIRWGTTQSSDIVITGNQLTGYYGGSAAAGTPPVTNYVHSGNTGLA